MKIRATIPAVEGIQDPQVMRVLIPMKQIIDQLIGHTPHSSQIKTLGADANLYGVIDKVNDIIALLQDAQVPKPPIPARMGLKTLTVSTSVSVSGVNTGDQTLNITGDVTGTSTGAGSTTNLTSVLATVSTNVGTFGTTNTVPRITVNAKGLVTQIQTATITPASIGAISTASSVAAGTNTKVAYDVTGRVTVGSTASLASADFVNQGSAATVLHGNASGNPVWGAVQLGTDVAGVLPLNNITPSMTAFAAAHG